MAVEHCHDNGTMSRQMMSKNPKETLELCHDIAKFVATKASKSSQSRDNCFYVTTKPPEISDTWQGKNVMTFETFSRQL